MSAPPGAGSCWHGNPPNSAASFGPRGFHVPRTGAAGVGIDSGNIECNIDAVNIGPAGKRLDVVPGVPYQHHESRMRGQVVNREPCFHPRYLNAERTRTRLRRSVFLGSHLTTLDIVTTLS